MSGGGLPRREHEALYRDFLAQLAVHEPTIRIIPKAESSFCRLVDRALRVVTFGRQDRFMSEYTTVFGRRIYVPSCWESLPPGERYCTLRHELVHVRQFRRFTFAGMTLLYVLLPLPMGLAGGRALIELEAYRESLVACWQVYGAAAARDPAMIDGIVTRFTGPDYGWMWVFGGQVRRSLEKTLKALEANPPPALGRG